jgi:hypothetical protein
MSFRRALTGKNLGCWLHLVERLIGVELSDNDDVFIWKKFGAGRFTVQSMYKELMKEGRVPQQCVFPNSVFSKQEDSMILKKWCQRLEITTMEVFNQFGWNVKSRIQA